MTPMNAPTEASQYIEQTAKLLNLPVEDYQAEVVENFVKLATIAQLVTEFTLPSPTAAATVFQP